MVIPLSHTTTSEGVSRTSNPPLGIEQGSPFLSLFYHCGRTDRPKRLFASQGLWEDASRDLSAGLRGDQNDVRNASTFARNIVYMRVLALRCTWCCGRKTMSRGGYCFPVLIYNLLSSTASRQTATCSLTRTNNISEGKTKAKSGYFPDTWRRFGYFPLLSSGSSPALVFWAVVRWLDHSYRHRGGNGAVGRLPSSRKCSNSCEF